jgi:hypothetical protein
LVGSALGAGGTLLRHVSHVRTRLDLRPDIIWTIRGGGQSQQSSQLVFESIVVRRRDNGWRKLDASIEPRTRPDAEGIRMEQEEAQSDVERRRGYD